MEGSPSLSEPARWSLLEGGADAEIEAAWNAGPLGLITDPAAREDLLADALSVTFPAAYQLQQVDYDWGEQASQIKLVVKGTLRSFLSSRSGRQVTLRYLRRGDLWGLGRTLEERGSWSTGMQVLSPSRVLLINGRKFMTVAWGDPQVAYALAKDLAHSLVLRTTSLESSVFASTSVRVAEHLSHLAIEDEAGVPTVLLSQQEIADSIGTVREVVARAIAQLRDRGIVKYSGRRLQILDMEALKREGQID